VEENFRKTQDSGTENRNPGGPRAFVSHTLKRSDEVKVLPRSLRSVADVCAARTQEKIGHSGRDDNLSEYRSLGARSIQENNVPNGR
jgi:hypothetical protein